MEMGTGAGEWTAESHKPGAGMTSVSAREVHGQGRDSAEFPLHTPVHCTLCALLSEACSLSLRNTHSVPYPPFFQVQDFYLTRMPVSLGETQISPQKNCVGCLLARIFHEGVLSKSSRKSTGFTRILLSEKSLRTLRLYRGLLH